MKDFDAPNPFFRVDLLTGCNNLVSFSKELDDNFDNKMLEPVSVIAVDLYQLHDINRSKGFDYGDSLLRWMGIAIKDVTESTVYRISGDNFVAVLVGGKHATHQATAQKLFDRLHSEALQLELVLPVARVAVIQFPENDELNPAVVWRNLNEKLELTTAAAGCTHRLRSSIRFTHTTPQGRGGPSVWSIPRSACQRPPKLRASRQLSCSMCATPPDCFGVRWGSHSG